MGARRRTEFAADDFGQLMRLAEGAPAARIRDLMARSGNPQSALRIGVKKGGCAGMEYTMDWAAEQGRFDEVVEDKGARPH